MTQHLYRFRKTVLGDRQELENQTIYCAPLAAVNDPMEGFLDLFWSGDTIVWRNLIKHYLLCLDHACILLMLNGNGPSIDINSLPVLNTEADLPTEEYRAAFRNSCEIFFSTSSVSEFVDGLASRQRPVCRDELCVYLRMLQPHALDAIARSYKARGIFFRLLDDDFLHSMCRTLPVRPEIISSTNEFESRHPGADGSEPLWAAMNAVHLQTLLISKYNNPAFSTNKNGILTFAEFPDRYVRSIERMVYADWYVACFAGNYTNSSMWAHYADGHRGVCLKFRTGDGEGNHALALDGGGVPDNNASGLAGNALRGRTNRAVYRVSYSGTYPKIDFFRSLGRLRGIALRWWYSDEHGKSSLCARDVFENEADLRERYWREFLAGQTTKLEDWRYEDEYRLVLWGSVPDYSAPASRALKYVFSDLQGIIFGINTSEADKLESIRVAQAKCAKEGRKDFEFFQAYYAKGTGKIEATRLDLIRF